MDRKVIVVTGASGALGRVVVEAALARGIRVAAVDHAVRKAPDTDSLISLGGVDLADAAQATMRLSTSPAPSHSKRSLTATRRHGSGSTPSTC
jgi:3-oxoacyl-[acyl-carrier protein] reductase